MTCLASQKPSQRLLVSVKALGLDIDLQNNARDVTVKARVLLP